MSEITRAELEVARARVRQWPVEERRWVTKLTEPEVRTVALLTALLDIRPHEETHEDQS